MWRCEGVLQRKGGGVLCLVVVVVVEGWGWSVVLGGKGVIDG